MRVVGRPGETPTIPTNVLRYTKSFKPPTAPTLHNDDDGTTPKQMAIAKISTRPGLTMTRNSTHEDDGRTQYPCGGSCVLSPDEDASTDITACFL